MSEPETDRNSYIYYAQLYYLMSPPLDLPFSKIILFRELWASEYYIIFRRSSVDGFCIFPSIKMGFALGVCKIDDIVKFVILLTLH